MKLFNNLVPNRKL